MANYFTRGPDDNSEQNDALTLGDAAGSPDPDPDPEPEPGASREDIEAIVKRLYSEACEQRAYAARDPDPALFEGAADGIEFAISEITNRLDDIDIVTLPEEADIVVRWDDGVERYNGPYDLVSEDEARAWDRDDSDDLDDILVDADVDVDGIVEELETPIDDLADTRRASFEHHFGHINERSGLTPSDPDFDSIDDFEINDAPAEQTVVEQWNQAVEDTTKRVESEPSPYRGDSS